MRPAGGEEKIGMIDLHREGVRRCLLGAAFIVLLLAALERGGFGQTHTHAVRRLAPDVYFWQGDHVIHEPANVGWVIFQDYVFVIDANFPWGAREILPEIRKTTDKPIRFLFNTHYHADHSYGNGVFAEAGAAVVCTADCLAEARSKGPSDTKNQARGRADFPMVNASVVFPDTLAFDDGQHRVELIRMGPAHTIGDAVAYLPKEKIAFIGDLAVNWTWGNNFGDPDADYANWLRALDKLMQWDLKTVVPAHGSVGTADILRGQRAYLNDMWTQVRRGLQAGKTPEQLVQEIDLSRHQPFGERPESNAGGIRAMCRNAPKQKS